MLSLNKTLLICADELHEARRLCLEEQLKAITKVIPKLLEEEEKLTGFISSLPIQRHKEDTLR